MTDSYILCYGEIDLDIYLSVNRFPKINSAASVRDEFVNVGGAAGNTAVWLANWDVPVRLSGHEMGADVDGELIRSQLAQYPKLDTRFVVYQQGYNTPRCQCLVNPDGERTFIVHWPTEVAVTPLSQDMLHGIRWLNLDMSGALEPRLNAARLARSQNISIMVNDVYAPNHPLVGLADMIVLSASVARTKQPDTSVKSLAEAIRRAGQCDVVVTDGAHTVELFSRTGDNMTFMPPKVSVVDTTGAGDIFKAGLLYGLTQQLPIEQAIKWAVAAGSAKAGRAGTTLNPAPLSVVQDLVDSVVAMKASQ